MTTFSVIRHATGLLSGGLTLAEAGRAILTYDSRQFEVRQDRDGDGRFTGRWTLWVAGSRNGPMNRSWSSTIINVAAASEAEAERRACEEVARSPAFTEQSGFSVMTDDEYRALEYA